MSILKSVKAGKYALIEDWLKKNEIENSKIEDDSINVDNASVNLIGYNEKELPDFIKFKAIIEGDFLCSYGRFTTMKGFSSICS